MKTSRLLLLHCLLPMLVSLVFYTFFRSQDTIVNQALSYLLGYKPPVLRLAHGQWLVYSLPGALWLYAFLWLSSLAQSKFLTVLPLLLALGIEAVQLVHLTDGTFDPVDVLCYLLAALAFVGLGGLAWVARSEAEPVRMRQSRRYRAALVFFMVVVVLSDVLTK